ncbi:MAG: DNA-binding protein [Solidesulfovibrio sp.]|uniref:helix-turn-helix transcriptional regulator n=1 Tax=Solidesulfovibrio sp. TaxID=2910990 RepID=UPI002B1FFE16|nr:DNA-binding protein [Solidesulfovibrio sp.]MEA4857751.1 DNA-binding protein [Solidesulfovibrio sp.]
MRTAKAVMGEGLSIRYEVVDEKDAAIYVGLSVKALQMRRATHKAPAYIKVGRSVRYRIADLDAFLAAHRIDPERAA